MIAVVSNSILYFSNIYIYMQKENLKVRTKYGENLKVGRRETNGHRERDHHLQSIYNCSALLSFWDVDTL
jgi:hypothetical protein